MTNELGRTRRWDESQPARQRVAGGALSASAAILLPVFIEFL
jgi:hypothetical protein